ncbi:MAG TPA: 2-amino-4-hydroxy-6-hydroxymethyldihydropteridine diphosphokinase [bacterium]|nr:2-amino-4-hydroxy-6-hydroxymethyldihydropteridine diphosphokinase [bacterium]
MSARAFLSLGGNLGDRRATIEGALAALDRGGATVVRRSAFYETAPWGKTDQPDFLNIVVEVRTDLLPHDLLALCRRVEQAFGRTRAERWGPRTLDVDILLYDAAVLAGPELILPHPHLTERRFVLEPLLELEPHAALPDGRPLRPFLQAVSGQVVRRLPDGEGARGPR